MPTLKTPTKQITNDTNVHYFTTPPDHSLISTLQSLLAIHNNLQQSTIRQPTQSNVTQSVQSTVTCQLHQEDLQKSSTQDSNDSFREPLYIFLLSFNIRFKGKFLVNINPKSFTSFTTWIRFPSKYKQGSLWVLSLV